jgi:hypothetical protein
MDINTALVAAIGRMQSKMEKQRVHIRKLEEQRSYVMTANAGLRDTIDEHNRIFEHDRKEHAAQLGAANVKYEIEINNMRKERSNLILDRDWWKETAHAVAKKYEDTSKQLREKARSMETQINGLKVTMRDMAVLIIAYEAGHRWDADARDMIQKYAGCDWMQQARSDFKECENADCSPACISIEGRPFEPEPDSIVPGQHTFSPIEGRPFGRNEHEAEEYKPPVIKLEDTIRQIDGAMNAEVFERLARLEQRVMNHEERIKHVDAVQEEVEFRVLPPLQEKVRDMEERTHLLDNQHVELEQRIGVAEERIDERTARIEALEQRTHTHAPDDGK